MPTTYAKEQIYRDWMGLLPPKPKPKRPERQYHIAEPSAVRAIGLGATGITPLPREKAPEQLPPSPEELSQRRIAAAGRGAELFKQIGHVPLREIVRNLSSDDPYELEDAFEVSKENTRQAGIAEGLMPQDIEPALAEIDRIRQIMQTASYKKRQAVEKERLAMERAQAGRAGLRGVAERIPQKVVGGALAQIVRPLAGYLAREQDKTSAQYKRGMTPSQRYERRLSPEALEQHREEQRLVRERYKDVADWVDNVLKEHPHWTAKQFEQGVGALEDPLALLDNIVGSVPLMATAVTATAAGHPEVAMMLIYAVENQSAYEEAYAFAIQEGKTPQDADAEATRIGQIVGTANAIIEYAQIRGIMRVSGIAKGGLHKVVMGLAQKSNAANPGAHLVTVAREVLFEMAREYGEEGAQNVVSTLVPAVIQDKPFDVWEMLEQSHKEGLAAAGAVAVFGGPRVAGAAAKAVTRRKPTVKPPAPAPEPAAAAEALNAREIEQLRTALNADRPLTTKEEGLVDRITADWPLLKDMDKQTARLKAMLAETAPAPTPKPVAAVQPAPAKPAAVVAPVAPEAPKAREAAPERPEAKAVVKPEAKPPAVAKAKEPWQMTRKEYVVGQYTAAVDVVRPDEHQRLVKEAVMAGKPVPAAALELYPKLAALAKKVQRKPKKAELPEWEVTVEQMIKIGQRKVAEPVERRFTVRAKTAHQARKAVEGKIVNVERVAAKKAKVKKKAKKKVKKIAEKPLPTKKTQHSINMALQAAKVIRTPLVVGVKHPTKHQFESAMATLSLHADSVHLGLGVSTKLSTFFNIDEYQRIADAAETAIVKKYGPFATAKLRAKRDAAILAKPAAEVTTAEDYASKYETPTGGMPFESDEAARREKADYLLVFANDPNRDLFHRQRYAQAAAKILDPTKVVGDIRKFTKEDWLEIKGIGPKIATKLSQSFVERSAEVMELAQAQRQTAVEAPKPPPKAKPAPPVVAPEPEVPGAVGGLEIAGQFREAEAVAKEAAADVERQAKRLVEVLATEEPTKAVRRRKTAVRKFVGIEQDKPEIVALRLGPKEGSIAHEVLALKIMEGYERKLQIMQEARDVMREAGQASIWDSPKKLAKWSYDATSGKKVQMLSVPIPGKNAQQKGKFVNSLKLSRSDIMDFALQMRDSDTRNWVEQGAPWVFDRGARISEPVTLTPKGIDAIIAASDKPMTAMVEAAFEFFNGPLFRQLNATWVEEHGVNLVDKAQTDHVPRVRASEHIQTGAEAPVAPGTLPTAQAYTENIVLEDMGIFKERTGGLSPIQGRDFFSRYIEHVNKVSQYTGLSIPIKNARWLLGNPTFKQAIAKAGARDSANFLDQYLKDVEGMRVKPIVPHMTIMRWLRKQIYRVGLGLNVFTGMKMASSYYLASNEIQHRHLVAGLSATTAKLSEVTNWLMEDSAFLRNRLEATGTHVIGPTVNRRVMQLFFTGKTGDWDAKLMKVLHLGDKAAITRLGRAAVSEAKAQGLTGGQIRDFVVRRTEFLVRRTQPVWGAVYESALARRAHTDRWALVATMFSAQTNQNLAMVRKAHWEYRNSRKGPAAKARFLKVYANTLIVNTLLMVGINELRRWVLRGFRPRDEEDKWGLLDYAMDSVRNLTRIFYGGKAASDLAAGILKGARKRWPTDPAEGMMDDAVLLVAGAFKAIWEWDARYQRGPKKGELKAITTGLKVAKRGRRLGFMVFGIPDFPYQVTKAFLPPGREESIKRLRKAYKYSLTVPADERAAVHKTLETERKRLGLTDQEWRALKMPVYRAWRRAKRKKKSQ